MTPTQEPNQNEQLKSERPLLNEVSARLLNSKEIQELPVQEQGRVIIDRFIGSIVRQGEISGVLDSYDPRDTLALMDFISSKGEDSLNSITRANGLREAVKQLSLDTRTASLFGSLESRVEATIDDQGKENLTFTSAAQIEGYLLAGGNENRVKNPYAGIHMEGDSWIPVILDQVQKMSNNPSLSWVTQSQAIGLMRSSIPSNQNAGKDWAQASRSAEKVGVDMEIIKRSAEKLQQRTMGVHDLGATALFLATRKQIASYQKDFDRRGH